MNWAELGREVVQMGLPLLGAALPLPGGAALGTALASALGGNAAVGNSPPMTPDGILAALRGSAEAAAAARQFELTHQATMLQMTLAADTAQMQAVNATIQGDAKGQSWLQQNHHAIECLMVTALIGAVYFLLPLLKVQVPSIPSEAFMMLGAVLGVTAWHGGVADRITAGTTTPPPKG